MVSDVFLEQLRNACPLEEIARTYVDLKRRGRTYVCNCPFHSEKTPSFTVFPDTQSFYCFGCGAGGDVITFIQQIENLDFMDAVKLLDNCGEAREALSQQQSELYTKLADLNRELRQVRKQIKMCEEIRAQAAAMQENIREIEHPELEVKNHDKQR